MRLKKGCKIKLQCLVRPEVLSKIRVILFFQWFGHYNTVQKAVFRTSTTDKYLFSGPLEIKQILKKQPATTQTRFTDKCTKLDWQSGAKQPESVFWSEVSMSFFIPTNIRINKNVALQQERREEKSGPLRSLSSKPHHQRKRILPEASVESNTANITFTPLFGS